MEIFEADILLTELKNVLTVYDKMLETQGDSEQDLRDQIAKYQSALDFTTDLFESIMHQMPTGLLQ